MKKYYFYFDEGGAFGNANVCISTKKLEYVESRYDSHICNYFFGRLEITSITRHLQLFKIAYPKCDIVYDILSDIKNLDLTHVGA